MTEVEYCEKCSDAINMFANECLSPCDFIPNKQRARVKELLFMTLGANGYFEDSTGEYHDLYDSIVIWAFRDTIVGFLIGLLHEYSQVNRLALKTYLCLEKLENLHEERRLSLSKE